MSKKMKILLKDGTIVSLRKVSSNYTKEDPKQYLKYIKELLKNSNEDVYISREKTPTLKEEIEWVKSLCEGAKKNQRIDIVVEDKDKIVGMANAWRGKRKEKNNVTLGIAMLKDYRGKGLGKFLLNHIIEAVRDKWNPKNIVLEYEGENEYARKVYEKVGFVEFARFPNWTMHKNRYMDTIWMRLEK
ncbi:GNAT family N-acetyltransferase [Candidatus Micrarchaeota archaeon]|jgi:RimJ/RimL family protein N-acetyltransferase|nr:GNAT family N-acetyltransferase [Candidatus Micrarchaeota archaeon]